MALDLGAIRSGITGFLEPLIADDLNYYPYIPKSPAYPYVGLVSGDPYISYYETFASSVVGSLCDMRLELIVGQNAEAMSAQTFIDRLLCAGTGKSSSIIDAIESDMTLGGVVAACIPRFANPIVFAEDGAATASVPLQIAIRRT